MGLVLSLPLALIAVCIAINWAIVRATPGSRHRVRRRQAASPLAHELPYWHIANDGLIVGVDGTYSAGLLLCGVDTDCMPSEELGLLDQRLQSVLHTLEAGITLQWIHITDHDHEAVLARYRANASAHQGIGARIAKDKVEAVRAMAGLRRSRLYVFVSTANPRQRAAAHMGGRASFPDLTLAAHQDDAGKLARVLSQLRCGLEAIGVAATALAGPETRALAYEFLNPRRSRVVPGPGTGAAVHRRSTAAPARYLSQQTAREQLAFSGVEEHPTTLTIDGQLTRMVTMRALPTHTDSAFLERLTVLIPFACRVQVTVDILSQEEAMSSLKRARKRADALVQASHGENPEAIAQYRDLGSLIDALLGGSMQLVDLALCVVLAVDAALPHAEEILQQQTDEVMRLIGSLDGAQGMVEKFAQLDSFLASLPGNGRHYGRAHRCTSDNACHLLLAWQSWGGTDTPAALVANGRGYLVGIDPFAEHLNNPNAVMAGVAGSGKSATTNYLLMHLFASGCKGLIVDIGGSYQRLLHLFGGDYISLQNDAALNLFYAPAAFYRADGTPDDLRLSLMLSVLEILLLPVERARLSNEERSILDIAVRALYERAADAPILGDLKAWLERATFSHEEDTSIARGFARRLRFWTEGPHARLLNRPSTIELTTDFAGFDLKGLPEAVKPVVLLILSGIIWNLVMADDTERKCVVFDEVWSLLKHPVAMEMLEELYRTTRKYRCSILAISQSVEDFTASAVASAVVQNSSTKYLLKHDFGHDVIGETFKLNAREKTVFRDLEMRRGQFAEVLMMTGTHRFVARVVLTPLEYWIATSHPTDKAALKAVRDKYPERSLLEQLLYCAKRWPSGAANRSVPSTPVPRATDHAA